MVSGYMSEQRTYEHIIHENLQEEEEYASEDEEVEYIEVRGK